MRAIVQRVKSASVEVDGTTVSKIGPGLLCLLGIRDTDTATDAEYICRKILKSRAWPHPDTGRPWELDVVAREGEVLCVSQFTLYGRLRKKNKPDYSKAMAPAQANAFYEQFVERVRTEYVADRVKDGVFGAMMDVSLVNDGPVTFILDSESSD